MIPQDTTTVPVKQPCEHCSRPPSYVYHDGRCPSVRAIEYYPNGGIKRVEYVGVSELSQPDIVGCGMHTVLPEKTVFGQDGDSIQ